MLESAVPLLPLEEEGTPHVYLPSIASLLDGGRSFSLHQVKALTSSFEMGNDFENGDKMGGDHHEEDDNGEEDFHVVDMTSCEMILGEN